jgi:predicted DNA-binding transcriptional regulator YafY
VTTEPDVPPFLRVVKGDPTPEELAALVVAVQAVAAAEPSPEPAPHTRGGWNDLESLFPPALHDGPGVWRASGRLRGVRTKAAW